VKGPDAFARVAAVNAYHVFGVLFAVWAVIVSFLGITREDFPATAGAQRAVATVSVLLALATIGSAIYTGATEEDEEGGEAEQALILGL
jgi:multisubunit Na+/H+ antiporter MnhG subunit